MSEPMSDEALADIERVWSGASPGPWKYERWNLADAAGSMMSLEIALERDEDARAIEQAPVHVAALLAEVKRLRALERAEQIRRTSHLSIPVDLSCKCEPPHARWRVDCPNVEPKGSVCLDCGGTLPKEPRL